MHPSEQIFNSVMLSIKNSIESVKTVLMVDQKPSLSNMPLVILGGGSEDIEPYHNQYLVSLELTARFYLAADGSAQDLKTLAEMIGGVDQAVKNVSGVMTVNENGQSNIERGRGLERTILFTEKSYLLTYRRSRGF